MAEKIWKIERNITPESLLQDNSSAWAKHLQNAWYKEKDAKLLTVVHSCSDARVSATTAFNHPGIVSLRSIASANTNSDGDPYSFLYRHPAVSKVIILEHFDSEEYVPGSAPKGCGGLGVKEKVGRGADKPERIRTPLDYVNSKIAHNDLAIQAIVSASRAAMHTKAPVLAAAIDHRTYQLYPLAIFQGENIRSAIQLGDLLDYDPKRIYRNGIPHLTELQYLPNPFGDLVWANEERHQILSADPEFMKSQKVQNPGTVMISTDIRPAGIRYPATLGPPNSAFITRLPINKMGGFHVEKKDLEETVAQATYALGKAADAKPGESFYNTSNLLIETPDLRLSEEIAAEVLNNEEVQRWRKNKNGQVMVGEVKSIEDGEEDRLAATTQLKSI